jgi:hypothetical protein
MGVGVTEIYLCGVWSCQDILRNLWRAQLEELNELIGYFFEYRPRPSP